MGTLIFLILRPLMKQQSLILATDGSLVIFCELDNFLVSAFGYDYIVILFLSWFIMVTEWPYLIFVFWDFLLIFSCRISQHIVSAWLIPSNIVLFVSSRLVSSCQDLFFSSSSRKRTVTEEASNSAQPSDWFLNYISRQI